MCVMWFLTCLHDVVLISTRHLKRLLRRIFLHSSFILISINLFKLWNQFWALDRLLPIDRVLIIPHWNFSQEWIAITTTTLSWNCSWLICLLVLKTRDFLLWVFGLRGNLLWLNNLYYVIFFKVISIIFVVMVRYLTRRDSTIFVVTLQFNSRCRTRYILLYLSPWSLGISGSCCLPWFLLCPNPIYLKWFLICGIQRV